VTPVSGDLTVAMSLASAFALTTTCRWNAPLASVEGRPPYLSIS
jgi:hypothetical protein